MAGSGLCCSSLEEPQALMKMGLGAIMVGHVNFLLGALVHGVVLRHINQHRQARAMLYSISNVGALTSGMVGVMVGILTIVLSKNKKSRSLVSITSVLSQTWSLFWFGLVSAVMSVASAIGLFISVVRAIVNNGRSLLTHCRFPDAIGYSSITNECPFDPTRIYSTTLILWVPLIVMCVVQLVFSARCSAACASFLGLPCCPKKKKSPPYIRASNVVKPLQEVYHSHYTDHLGSHNELAQPFTDRRNHHKTARSNTEPSRNHTEPAKPYMGYLGTPQKSIKPYMERPETPQKQAKPYTDRSGTPHKTAKSYSDHPGTPPKPTKPYMGHQGTHGEPQRRATAPPRQHQPPPRHLPHYHRSLPQSERQSQQQPCRERPERLIANQREPEEDQLLQRAAPERSSFWI